MKNFTDRELREIRRVLKLRTNSATPCEILGWQSPWSFDGFNAEIIIFLIDAKLGVDQ